MKILLLGSLVSQESMEQLNNCSREKASVAPVNYETMLVKGLQENGAQVEALSIPAVAAYPNSRLMNIRRKNEQLDCGVSIQWVPFINIQMLKQRMIRRNVTKMLKRWLEENKNTPDKVVLMYSIYPPYSKPAVDLCKKYGCHLCAVITDLPEYMYTWKKSTGLRGLYAKHLSDEMLKLQSVCDSYILFTEKMAERMGIQEKPYLVSEGFSDVSVYDGIPDCEKYETPTVLYGGNLSKLYGIRALVDGFMMTSLHAELHLYGAGADESYILECASKDPRIKYFGRVSRAELLTALKKAHLLVINKPTADDYSNYSFSSKILEYMASGTAVLTTRVGGMPTEYYDYFYFIDDETEGGISKAVSSAFMRHSDELRSMGMKAREFAQNHKNYKTQCSKIVAFLEDKLNEHEGKRR